MGPRFRGDDVYLLAAFEFQESFLSNERDVKQRIYFVYILASGRHGTLYIGVTSNVSQRLGQHRAGLGSEFVKKYGVHRLVHIEEFASPEDAIRREKQLKKWNRDWKIRLIESENPDWSDRSDLLT